MKKLYSDIIKLTKQLVATSSQSGIDSEKAIVGVVFKKLVQFDFSPKIVGSKKHPSVFCKISRNSKSKTVWLESCLDTVSAGDSTKWQYPPLKATIKDSKMYGRGVADCKIGIAIFCYLARELADKCNFILGFDANEQGGEFSGIRDIIKAEKPKADICILGYQGINEISIGARGWLRLKITTKGESAHTGSRSKRGVNAIHKMAKIICVLNRLKFSKIKKPYFEYGSNFNVSLIKGGTAINIVPNQCEAKIDIRYLPSQSTEEIIRTIKRFCEVEVLNSEPPFLTNPQSAFVKILQKTAQEELKTEIPITTSGPGSVGSIISQLKIPIINSFGCKCGNVHALNEWIDLETLPKAFDIYKKSILDFC